MENLKGRYVYDLYDGKKKKVFGSSGFLLFIGKNREPVYLHEVILL